MIAYLISSDAIFEAASVSAALQERTVHGVAC